MEDGEGVRMVRSMVLEAFRKTFSGWSVVMME